MIRAGEEWVDAKLRVVRCDMVGGDCAGTIVLLQWEVRDGRV